MSKSTKKSQTVAASKKAAQKLMIDTVIATTYDAMAEIDDSYHATLTELYAAESLLVELHNRADRQSAELAARWSVVEALEAKFGEDYKELLNR